MLDDVTRARLKPWEHLSPADALFSDLPDDLFAAHLELWAERNPSYQPRVEVHSADLSHELPDVADLDEPEEEDAEKAVVLPDLRPHSRIYFGKTDRKRFRMDVVRIGKICEIPGGVFLAWYRESGDWRELFRTSRSLRAVTGHVRKGSVEWVFFLSKNQMLFEAYSIKELEDFLNYAMEHGVHVGFIDDGWSGELTPGLIRQWLKAWRSRRIKRGLRKSKARKGGDRKSGNRHHRIAAIAPQVKEMVLSGVSVAEIARQLNISRPTIYSILRARSADAK